MKKLAPLWGVLGAVIIIGGGIYLISFLQEVMKHPAEKEGELHHILEMPSAVLIIRDISLEEQKQGQQEHSKKVFYVSGIIKNNSEQHIKGEAITAVISFTDTSSSSQYFFVENLPDLKPRDSSLWYTEIPGMEKTDWWKITATIVWKEDLDNLPGKVHYIPGRGSIEETPLAQANLWLNPSLSRSYRLDISWNEMQGLLEYLLDLSQEASISYCPPEEALIVEKLSTPDKHFLLENVAGIYSLKGQSLPPGISFLVIAFCLPEEAPIWEKENTMEHFQNYFLPPKDQGLVVLLYRVDEDKSPHLADAVLVQKPELQEESLAEKEVEKLKIPEDSLVL